MICYKINDRNFVSNNLSLKNNHLEIQQIGIKVNDSDSHIHETEIILNILFTMYQKGNRQAVLTYVSY